MRTIHAKWRGSYGQGFLTVGCSVEDEPTVNSKSELTVAARRTAQLRTEDLLLLNRWRERRNQRVAGARLVLAKILLILARMRRPVAGSRGIIRHPTERHGLDGPGEGRVGLPVFGVAAQVEEEIALPSRLEGRQGWGLNSTVISSPVAITTN